jgi:hypothetical protein
VIPAIPGAGPVHPTRAWSEGEQTGNLSIMAAPLMFPLPDAPVRRDFAAEAALQGVRTAATVARDRLAEIDGVRVIGPEISATGNRRDVRLAIDLRDSGRDAWQVACAMASRGFPLEAASNRAIIVRLTEDEVAEGVHERIAPALLLALWSTPAASASEGSPAPALI